MFTLSSAIAALEARLVVVRLGAEDQALDGDQHLEVRSLCWKLEIKTSHRFFKRGTIES